MTRFFEVLPGVLSWATLLILVALSVWAPAVVVVFIILYDLYWLLKIVYLFFHLRHSFTKMRSNLRVDWFARVCALPPRGDRPQWDEMYHLVILPMYREPLALIRATFGAFRDARYPKDKILIVLATEARAGEEDARVAETIRREFGEVFGGFLITVHPDGIPGELAGKGSNETWGARLALQKLVDKRGIPRRNVMVTVFDIDTRPGPDYFSVLTYHFLTEPDPYRASYQPIPLFTNNLHKVPAFARLTAFTASFWQFMQQSRPEQLVTFSSHSMSLEPLVEIGFWNTDIVSEDSRIFFQCYTHYDGNWRVVPLFYPIYMDAVEGATFFGALKNLYRQQRRWAWGIENIPFTLGAFMKRKMIPLKKRLFWSYVLLEGFHSWATSSFIIFLFGLLPNVLGGSAFTVTVLSYNLPRVTGFLLNLSALGIVTFAFLSMTLLSPRLTFERFHLRYYVYYLLQWVLMPATFLIFGAVPALDAQTRMVVGGRFRLGFWRTPKKG